MTNTTEKEVWKKDDILYSESYQVFRKIFSIIGDDIIFTSSTGLTLEKVNNDMEVEVVTKQYLKSKDYKLYNPKESKTVELTLEEIAQKFNVNVKDLKIKK